MADSDSEAEVDDDEEEEEEYRPPQNLRKRRLPRQMRDTRLNASGDGGALQGYDAADVAAARVRQFEMANIVAGNGDSDDEQYDPDDVIEIDNAAVTQAIDNNDEPLVLNPRNEWKWEKEPDHVSSKPADDFPEADYSDFKDKSPKDLFCDIFDDQIIEEIVARSNRYGMEKHGIQANITKEEMLVFIGILILSGYNTVKEFSMYWSNSEDVTNLMVKKAMPRDRFKTIKRCLHFGNEDEGEEGEVRDRYGKVRLLLKHLQKKFVEQFVPEQNLSHDESMIKYFGKSGLKQAIRNKPIRFGYKGWCLCTVSGYLVVFDLYQGRGIGIHHEENVAAVGAAGASLLDLMELLPPEKRILNYHVFGDNFFSSMKLVDVMRDNNWQYSGTLRKDRVKNKPAITDVDRFKKQARGHHECIALEDETQIVTRWNDNAPVTMLSSALGCLPHGTVRRWSKKDKRHIEVEQPNVVKMYNKSMGGVDRFDQNNNHCRINVGGKKWYWSIVTWCIDTSVQNAWQLHRKSGGKLSNLQFRREIACVLLRQNVGNKTRRPSGGRMNRAGDVELRYDNVGHYLIVKQNVRAICAFKECRAKCQTYCEKCDRAICTYHFKGYHMRD